LIKRILLAAVLAGFAGQAQAQAVGRNAPPKPSGQVIHLFGPGSVLGNILPTGPASGRPAAPAGAAPAGAAPPAVAQAYQEPTMGDVLHQMFVTGDPNQAKGFPMGRQNLH
jgi:hypothetical protein